MRRRRFLDVDRRRRYSRDRCCHLLHLRFRRGYRVDTERGDTIGIVDVSELSRFSNVVDGGDDVCTVISSTSDVL